MDTNKIKARKNLKRWTKIRKFFIRKKKTPNPNVMTALVRHTTEKVLAFSCMRVNAGWLPNIFRTIRPVNIRHSQKSTAILQIQQWYRRIRAEHQLRLLAAVQLFQVLEVQQHFEQLKLQQFFDEVMQSNNSKDDGVGGSLKAVNSKIGKKIEKPLLRYPIMKYNSGEQFEHYGVKPIDSPLTKHGLTHIIKVVRRKVLHLMPPIWIFDILSEAYKKLKNEPNINEIKASDQAKEYIVCGSLFGNLKDLIQILRRYGMPKEKHRLYIFNGDLVDYGSNGIEVLIIVLGLYLLFDQAVFLNRGDHEDYLMNSIYGFKQELQQKYPDEHQHLGRAIDDVFRWMPIATLIHNRVLVVHGGVTAEMSIQQLKTIKRERYLSLLCPQAVGYEQKDWKQLYQLLCSRVCAKQRQGVNEQCLYNAMLNFTAAAARHFCNAHKLAYIVSSNDYSVHGCEQKHNRLTWIAFAASNFYGMNNGAVLRINRQLEVKPLIYSAEPAPTHSFWERIERIERAALHELGVFLNFKRQKLALDWQAKDPEHRGYITLSDWCESMQTVSELKVPWHLWQRKLAPELRQRNAVKIGDIYMLVDYNQIFKLLDSIDVLISFVGAQCTVFDMLVNNNKAMEVLFKLIDHDATGHVPIKEIYRLSDTLQKYLVADEVPMHMLPEICKLMDKYKYGTVDFSEFCESFNLVNEFVMAKRKEALFPACAATNLQIQKHERQRELEKKLEKETLRNMEQQISSQSKIKNTNSKLTN